MLLLSFFLESVPIVIYLISLVLAGKEMVRECGSDWTVLQLQKDNTCSVLNAFYILPHLILQPPCVLYLLLLFPFYR